MKLFELHWNHGDEMFYYLFTHENKTQAEWKQDIIDTLRKYGKDFLSSLNEVEWAGANNWIDYIADKLPELGYEPIDPIREVFWGGEILSDCDDYEDKEWKNILGDELFNMAIAHNKNINS